VPPGASSGFSGSGFPGASFSFSSGGFPSGGGFKPSNADDIFRAFFGGNSPFNDMMDMEDGGSPFGGGIFSSLGGMPGGMPRGMPGKKKTAPQSVKKTLSVPLEDLFTGTVKKLKVTRTYYEQNAPKQSEKILTVPIKAGWKAGTKIKFAGEGDEIAPGGPCQDIEFIIEEKSHPKFKRDGDSLRTTLDISLVEALTGLNRTIESLDGRQIPIIAGQNSTIQPGQVIQINGEGMPISKLPGKKGNLLVTIRVVLPDNLTAAQKSIIRENFKK
jgi:DnaJ family protein B protein 4